jgi:tetratricopeptide (TPR) repeat protein
LLKKDSSNVQYVEYTSFSLAKVWHDKEVGEDQSMPYYNKALYLAKKALKLDSNSAEAHYAYAFTIGVINEYASNKQQIANAKVMKDEIDKCLKLNPHHDGAYHLLGRWSRRMAEFNGVEKFAVKTLYGATLPEATYQDAANAFEKAYVYAPDYLLHQYELAYTYYEMNKYADAKTWLNQIINNTTYKGDDAQVVKDRSKKLLDKMN